MRSLNDSRKKCGGGLRITILEALNNGNRAANAILKMSVVLDLKNFRNLFWYVSSAFYPGRIFTKIALEKLANNSALSLTEHKKN